MTHVINFRRLLETKVPVLPYITQHEQLLDDGERVAEFLSPLMAKLLTTFDISSAPSEIQSDLRQTAEALLFYGLLTHCLLFEKTGSRRTVDRRVDLEQLYDEWLLKSLTATSAITSYDRDNQGIPTSIFDVVFQDRIEPLQKQLGLGWWRRIKNRNKFHNLFASGICLGMLYDLKTT